MQASLIVINHATKCGLLADTAAHGSATKAMRGIDVCDLLKRRPDHRDNAAMTRLISPLRRVAGISGQVEHTAYAHDWTDLLAQQEADQEQKQLDQREANRTRLRPSSVEIARMASAVI
jgi:hypothetical protein